MLSPAFIAPGMGIELAPKPFNPHGISFHWKLAPCLVTWSRYGENQIKLPAAASSSNPRPRRGHAKPQVLLKTLLMKSFGFGSSLSHPPKDPDGGRMRGPKCFERALSARCEERPEAKLCGGSKPESHVHKHLQRVQCAPLEQQDVHAWADLGIHASPPSTGRTILLI